MSIEALNVLFDGLDRLGPGDADTTREALALCNPLPERPYVLDLGCGTGASTLVLAEQIGSTVIGVDIHPPFLHTLRTRADERELDDIIDTRAANFAHLPYAPGSVDLLWSEGAIYLLGFRRGLERWAPLLRDGGFLVVSHLVWSHRVPPREARTFWEERYPEISTTPHNCEAAEKAGLRVVETLALPKKAWSNYYDPLDARLEEIEARGCSERGLQDLLVEARREIDLWREHGDAWKQEFYVLRKA